VLNFVPHDLSDPGGGRVCGTVKGILNLTTLFAELEYYYAIFLLGLAPGELPLVQVICCEIFL